MSILGQIEDLPLGTNYQIPNNLVNPAFGEVDLLRYEDFVSVSLTILADPVREGTRTGVALDGSESMCDLFGQGWRYDDSLDQTALDQFVYEGKGERFTGDGTDRFQAKGETFDKLRGLGLVNKAANSIEPMARAIVPYLAEKIDAEGATEVIYWGCGDAGEQIEEVGSFKADEARSAFFAGPAAWGQKTRLLPAFKYFVERFAGAEWSFCVFITDGRLDDLENVKDYTAELARRIQAGEAKPVKCVLIGVGDAIDEQQLIELDDLPGQRDLGVDIWDHKIAATTRGLRDLFAEAIDENAFVAPAGRVLTDSGELITDHQDGLPGAIKFDLPSTARGFIVEVGQERFEQKFF